MPGGSSREGGGRDVGASTTGSGAQITGRMSFGVEGDSTKKITLKIGFSFGSVWPSVHSAAWGFGETVSDLGLQG